MKHGQNFHRFNPACEEAREIFDNADPVTAERIRLHRERCSSCREFYSHIEEVRSSVAFTDQGLNDIARARIQMKLQDSFDRIATEKSKTDRALLFPWRVGLALSSVAVIVLLVLLLTRPREQMIAPRPEVATFAPYLLSGSAVTDLGPLGAKRASIRAGEKGSVRAAVAPFGWISLIGPGHVSIESDNEEALTLSLQSGLLLARVESTGRQFRVRAKETLVTVRGTVFAVDLRSEPVLVSVLRGSVSVALQDRMVQLSAGQRFVANEVSPITEEIAKLLEAHVASTTLTTGSSVLVLNGTPQIAAARIQNVMLGRAPLAVRLPAGSTPITMTADGHTEQELVAMLSVDQTTRMDYALAPQQKTEEPKTSSVTDRRRPLPRKKKVTAEALYRRAEEAFAAGERDEGTKLLSEVVKRFPQDPLAASALYELARNTRSADPKRARAYLEELLARGSEKTLSESAHFLLCRITVKEQQEDALSCFSTFRQQYPRSPHDQAALSAEARLAHRLRGCKAAVPLLDEYLRRYPKGPFAVRAKEHRARCPD